MIFFLVENNIDLTVIKPSKIFFFFSIAINHCATERLMSLFYKIDCQVFILFPEQIIKIQKVRNVDGTVRMGLYGENIGTQTATIVSR